MDRHLCKLESDTKLRFVTLEQSQVKKGLVESSATNIHSTESAVTRLLGGGFIFLVFIDEGRPVELAWLA